MDLAELKFVVITKDLETAADKIKALQAAIVSLNETQKSSSALAKDDASAQQIRIKSTIQMTKLKGQLAQAEANAQEATDRSTKSNNALGDSSDAVTKRLNKQADVLKLTRGQTIEVADGNLTLDRSFRQSQVSALANLKALGATTEQMQLFAGTFKELNTAAGFNPLDKMSSGLTQLTQEVKELSSVSKLMESNVNLSRGALVSLSRDVEATTAAMKAEGKTTQDIDGAIASLTNQYKTLSSQKEVFISQSNDAAAAAKREAQALLNIGKDDKRDQAQQLRETAKASSALEKELKRVDFVLTDVNANLQLSNSNRLLKFQDNLAKSGITGAEATKQLEAYRGKLELIQKNNAFQKQTLDATEYQKRVDYITRAVGPQLTDIFSGLATGQQSLYTIAIQQGGQLADQFSLAGIEANKMGGILANALPKMFTNITSIGKAFTQMAIAGFMGLGNSMITTVTDIGGVTKSIRELDLAIAIMGDNGSKAGKLLSAVFEGLSFIIKALAATAVLVIVAAFVALGVAIYQVAVEEKKLSIALNLTGAALGLSKDSAIAYAQSLNEVGISTTNGIAVITEMAKSGKLSSDSIKMVAASAIEMKNAAGVAIADTVKQFEKMKESPVDALVELAKATGEVSPATIELVYNLVEQGKKAEAVAIAMTALADANSAAAKRIIEDLHPLERLYKSIGSGISSLYEGIKEITRDDSLALLAKAQLRLSGYQINPQAHADKIAEEIALISTLTAKIIGQADAEFFRQQNAKGSSDVAANLKEQSKLEDIALGQSKIKITQQEYINAKIVELRKNLGSAALSTENLTRATQVYGEEWKRAQPKLQKVKLSDEQKAINKAMEQFIDIQNKANGVSNSFNNEIEGQQLLLKHNKISLEQYIAVVLDLIKTQKFSTDAAAADEKVRKETLQTQKAFLKVEEDIQKVRDEATKENLALNLRNELLGKTEEEQLKINRAYENANKLREIQVKLEADLTKIKNDQNLQKDPLLGFILQTQTINAYGKQVEAVNAGIATQAAEDMQKSFDSIKSILKDSVMSALFEGGESGGKKLREAIVDAFRNKITIVVDAVVNTLMGTALSAFKSLMTGSGDSSTGMDSLLSGSKSIYSAISGGFDKLSVSSQFGNFATSSVGQSMGLSSMQNTYDAYGGIGQSVQLTDTANSLSKTLGTASNLLGYANSAFKLSQGKIGEAAGGAIGQYFGGPLGNMIGSKLGAMVDSAFGGETRSGATYVSGADGRAVKQQGPSGGEIAGSDARRMFETTQAAIVDTLKAVGSKATLSGFVAGLESSSKGKGFQFAGGMINGKGFGESGGRDGGQFSFTSQDSKTAFENYGMQLSQSIVEALQATDDLPVTINKIIKEALGGNAVASLTSDAVNALLTTINAVVQTVNTFNAAVLTLPFENIKNLSFDAAAGLIAAAGGIGNLTTNLATFYDNFYSDEEKRQQVIKNINATTAGSGLDAATATRDSFRSLVEAQDLNTVSGQKTYASLISVAGAFAGITPIIKETESVIRSASDIASERLNLEKQYNELTMTSTQLLELERKGIDSSNVELFDRVNILKAEVQAAANLKTANDGYLSQILDIEKATMSSTDVRTLETKGMDSSTVVLYDRLAALKSEAAAAAQLAVIATQRTSLELKLYNLTHTAAEQLGNARMLEIATIDKSLEGYQHLIYIAEDAAAALIKSNELQKTRTELELELFNLTHTAAEQLANSRKLEVAAMDETLRPLKEQINAQKDYAEELVKSNAILVQRTAMELELFNLTHTAAEQLANTRSLEIKAMDSSLVPLQERINKEKDSAEALVKSNEILAQRTVLELELFNLTHTAAEQLANSRKLEIDSMDSSLVGIKKQIFAQQDLAEALVKSNEILAQRTALELELFNLTHTAVEQLANSRKLELDSLDSSLVGLKQQIFAQQDLAQALVKSNEILAQRTALELELFNLTHTAAEQLANSRKLELAAMDSSLIGLKQQIFAIQDLSTALQESKDNTASSYATLERSISAEKSRIDMIEKQTNAQIDALKVQESTAQDTFNLLTSLFDELKSNIKELYSEVDSTNLMQVNQARGIISSATSGSLPENSVLSDAISTVRSSLATNLYVNKTAQDRDRLLLANELSQIQDKAKDQLSTAELQLKALKDQIFNQEKVIEQLELQKQNLDNVLESSRLQISALNNIDESILTIPEAIEKLAKSIEEQNKLQLGQANIIKASIPVATSVGASVSPLVGASVSSSVSSSPFNSKFPIPTLASTSVGYAKILADQLANDPNGPSIYRTLMSYSVGGDGFSAFANGGSYKGGMALVGEQGPELINFDKPGQVYTASQSASMMGNDSGLVEALAKLNTEVEMLRIETRAIVTNTSKINKSVERVLVPTDAGDALQIKAVT
jgi:phage-related minor tail protein